MILRSLFYLAVFSVISLGSIFQLNATIDDELMEAIYDKNENRALEILQDPHSGINVHGAQRGEEQGLTWLHYAAEAGAERVADHLIERGVRAFAVDNKGYTPAEYARMHRHNQLEQRLRMQEVSEGNTNIIVNLITAGRAHIAHARSQNSWGSSLSALVGWSGASH